MIHLPTRMNRNRLHCILSDEMFHCAVKQIISSSSVLHMPKEDGHRISEMCKPSSNNAHLFPLEMYYKGDTDETGKT